MAERVLRAVAARAGLVLLPGAAARAARFAARALSGRRVDIGSGLIAEAAFDRLVITRGGAAPAALTLAGDAGEATFGAWRVSWRLEPAPERLAREGWVTWVAPGDLALRGPGAGDRLIPLGATGHRRVARLLMEARVARSERAGWPVLVDANALWVPGVCRGAARVPGPGSLSVRVDVGRS